MFKKRLTKKVVLKEGRKNGLLESYNAILRLLRESGGWKDPRAYIIEILKVYEDEVMECEDSGEVYSIVMHDLRGQLSSSHISKRDMWELEAALDSMKENGELDPDSIDETLA